jgi:hypothetical protein
MGNEIHSRECPHWLRASRSVNTSTLRLSYLGGGGVRRLVSHYELHIEMLQPVYTGLHNTCMGVGAVKQKDTFCWRIDYLNPKHATQFCIPTMTTYNNYISVFKAAAFQAVSSTKIV